MHACRLPLIYANINHYVAADGLSKYVRALPAKEAELAQELVFVPLKDVTMPPISSRCAVKSWS
jgi:hypothetical protein